MSSDYKDMKDLILRQKTNFETLNNVLIKNKKMIKNLQLKYDSEEEKFIEEERKNLQMKKMLNFLKISKKK